MKKFNSTWNGCYFPRQYAYVELLKTADIDGFTLVLG